MSNLELQGIRAQVSEVYASWGRNTSIAQVRSDWENLFADPHLPARLTSVEANGVSCVWVEAAASTRRSVVLFLHGGGYQTGSHKSHHNLMTLLSGRSGCSVLAVDYRLAPEHRYPAAIEDAMTAYRWLLGQGFDASSIALCGDSAGGALAVVMLTLLRGAGETLPRCAVLMSPWIDLQALGASYVENAATDPITGRATILRMARTYLGREGRADAPDVSVLHASLESLPPLLIQAGEAEVLLDDAKLLLQRALAVGVEARLSLWKDMPHVFQLFAGRLATADAAIEEAATFLSSLLNHPENAPK